MVCETTVFLNSLKHKNVKPTSLEHFSAPQKVINLLQPARAYTHCWMKNATKGLAQIYSTKWAKVLLKCCEISWLFAFSTWTQELLPVREGTIFVRSFWAMPKMYRPLTSRHKLLHLVSARNVSRQEARKVTLFSYAQILTHKIFYLRLNPGLSLWIPCGTETLWPRYFWRWLYIQVFDIQDLRSGVAAKSFWLNLLLAVHNQEQSSIKFTTKHFH